MDREDDRANDGFGGAPLARSLRVVLRDATVDGWATCGANDRFPNR
jgi:hypothetical protein